MKHAKILYNEQPVWGIVEGTNIELENGQSVGLDEARYLPPAMPSKILAPHLTYRSRCLEYKMTHLPQEPHFFLMPPTAISYHKAPVARPKGCHFLNYEGEVAIVIGKRCCNAPVEEALDYVQGYTIANDWGVHDFRHADRGAMTRVKGQDGFCPIGPFLVDTADLDPADLTLRTYVNGEMVQEAHTGSDLMFSFAYQIADIARLITLEPGDVVLTGTPANSRPVEIGDVVEVEVSGIGRLQNRVVELERDLVKAGYQPQVTAATLHVALAIPEEEAERRLAEFQAKNSPKESQP